MKIFMMRMITKTMMIIMMTTMMKRGDDKIDYAFDDDEDRPG